ncbi:MAG: hypothetical protein H8E37_03405 [Planctomycetes bacterium]|nr:hypothetical protein [Planctomycetota bacterium]
MTKQVLSRRKPAASILAGATLLAGLTSSCLAQGDPRESLTATVAGSTHPVKTIRQGKLLFLNANDLAKAIGQEAKVVSGGKLLTFCRTGENELCIPIPLRNVKTLEKDTQLFVEASVLARALRLEIDDQTKRVLIRRSTASRNDEDDVPGFNAAWGERRGFRRGDTLPDIPLMDMQGREVRFSQFLGKRYIIYCWASW